VPWYLDGGTYRPRDQFFEPPIRRIVITIALVGVLYILNLNLLANAAFSPARRAYVAERWLDSRSGGAGRSEK